MVRFNWDIEKNVMRGGHTLRIRSSSEKGNYNIEITEKCKLDEVVSAILVEEGILKDKGELD